MEQPAQRHLALLPRRWLAATNGGYRYISVCSGSDGSSGLLLLVVHMTVGLKHVQHALLPDGLLMDTHISQMDALSLSAASASCLCSRWLPLLSLILT